MTISRWNLGKFSTVVLWALLGLHHWQISQSVLEDFSKQVKSIYLSVEIQQSIPSTVHKEIKGYVHVSDINWSTIYNQDFLWEL